MILLHFVVVVFTIGLYWVQAAGLVISNVFLAQIFTLVSSFIQTGLLVSRWITNGHFPLSNLYESLLFLSWTLTSFLVWANFRFSIVPSQGSWYSKLKKAFFLESSLEQNRDLNFDLTQKREKPTAFSLLGSLIMPVVGLIYGFTLFLPVGLKQSTFLVPALQSHWLEMHVVVMISAYGFLILGCLLAIAYLVISYVYAEPSPKNGELDLEPSSRVDNFVALEKDPKNKLDQKRRVAQMTSSTFEPEKSHLKTNGFDEKNSEETDSRAEKKSSENEAKTEASKEKSEESGSSKMSNKDGDVNEESKNKRLKLDRLDIVSTNDYPKENGIERELAGEIRKYEQKERTRKLAPNGEERLMNPFNMDSITKNKHLLDHRLYTIQETFFNDRSEEIKRLLQSFMSNVEYDQLSENQPSSDASGELLNEEQTIQMENSSEDEFADEFENEFADELEAPFENNTVNGLEEGSTKESVDELETPFENNNANEFEDDFAKEFADELVDRFGNNTVDNSEEGSEEGSEDESDESSSNTFENWFANNDEIGRLYNRYLGSSSDNKTGSLNSERSWGPWTASHDPYEALNSGEYNGTDSLNNEPFWGPWGNEPGRESDKELSDRRNNGAGRKYGDGSNDHRNNGTGRKHDGSDHRNNGTGRKQDDGSDHRNNGTGRKHDDGSDHRNNGTGRKPNEDDANDRRNNGTGRKPNEGDANDRPNNGSDDGSNNKTGPNEDGGSSTVNKLTNQLKDELNENAVNTNSTVFNHWNQTLRHQRWSKLSEILSDSSYRVIGIGFPLLTMGLLSGAVWANQTWGSYWSWDPKETWALITWFVFAIYLHMRLSRGWRGRQSAWLAVVGFISLWVCYLGVNLLAKGLHSYGFFH